MSDHSCSSTCTFQKPSSQTGKNKLIAEHLNSQIQNSEVAPITLKEEVGFGSLIFTHLVRGDLAIEEIDVRLAEKQMKISRKKFQCI